MSSIDWSIGSYERTAATLDEVSETVVAQAQIAPGDRVLDIACGTGNAALKAAALGAQVTGVDLAPRLVLVASERARAAGLEARFVPGDAQELPIADASADVALSVFGLIFAPDQRRVAAEVARVLAPGGRALITAWIREGALAESGAAMARARSRVQRAPAGEPTPGRTPVDWGDAQTVRELFAAHPVSVDVAPASVPFVAVSPEAYTAEQAEHHPLWLDAHAALGDEPFAALLREQTDILHAHNEDPVAFRITSRYVLVTVVRD